MAAVQTPGDATPPAFHGCAPRAHPGRARWRASGGRRFVDRAVSCSLVLAAACLLTVSLGALTGHRFLIDRSASMSPAIAAGDMLIVAAVRPDTVDSGDIVTFTDPDQPERTITHRAVQVTAGAERVAFVTRGDANGTSERWSVDRNGRVGVTRAVLPRLGYVVAWLGQPWMRFGLISIAGATLGAMALRAIWR